MLTELLSEVNELGVVAKLLKQRTADVKVADNQSVSSGPRRAPKGHRRFSNKLCIQKKAQGLHCHF